MSGLTPIGTIHTPFGEPRETPVQGRLAGTLGYALIDSEYIAGLADLQGFSHVTLIYGFDRCQGHSLEVTPYLDDRPRGVFSTRAPRRPNALGMTVVELLSVDGARLELRGVDMLDATPLFDIKPFVPLFDMPAGDVRCGWLERHLERLREAAPRADDRFHEPPADQGA